MRHKKGYILNGFNSRTCVYMVNNSPIRVRWSSCSRPVRVLRPAHRGRTNCIHVRHEATWVCTMYIAKMNLWCARGGLLTSLVVDHLASIVSCITLYKRAKALGLQLSLLRCPRAMPEKDLVSVCWTMPRSWYNGQVHRVSAALVDYLGAGKVVVWWLSRAKGKRWYGELCTESGKPALHRACSTSPSPFELVQPNVVLINPRRACAARVTGLCVCVSVKSHLTYGASVRPENAVTYSAGKEGQNICGVFSETAPLQRSSTPSVVRLMRSRPFLSLLKMRMRMSSPSISGALAHVYTLQPLRRGFALH